MKLLLIIILFIGVSSIGLHRIKAKEEESLTVDQAKQMARMCFYKEDYINCIGSLAGKAKIKINKISENDEFAMQHLLYMNLRVDKIITYINTHCINNVNVQMNYNNILQELKGRKYDIKEAIKADIDFLKDNKNVAFTSIKDEVYVSEPFIYEFDGKNLKNKIPFSVFHEAIHVIIGKKGGIIPNFSDSTYYIESITNYLAKEYAVNHKEQIDVTGIRTFYPYATRFIADCVTFLGNNNFIKDFFTKIDYSHCNYQLADEVNQFGILPQGINIMTNKIFQKIKVIEPLSTITREIVKQWLSSEVPQKQINTLLFDFFTCYNNNHPGQDIFTWLKKIIQN